MIANVQRLSGSVELEKRGDTRKGEAAARAGVGVRVSVSVVGGRRSCCHASITVPRRVMSKHCLRTRSPSLMPNCRCLLTCGSSLWPSTRPRPQRAGQYVRSDRKPRHAPCRGRAMTPILPPNQRKQHAVSRANVLGPKVQRGIMPLQDRDLAEVQWQPQFPIRCIQLMQAGATCPLCPHAKRST